MQHQGPGFAALEVRSFLGYYQLQKDHRKNHHDASVSPAAVAAVAAVAVAVAVAAAAAAAAAAGVV